MGNPRPFDIPNRGFDGLGMGFDMGAYEYASEAPKQPENLSPIEDATDVPFAPTLTASAFNDADTSDTHRQTAWQLRPFGSEWTAAILDVVTSNPAQSTSYQITPGVLTEGQTYEWRVRYQDNALIWSAWSDPTSFTTLATLQIDLPGSVPLVLARIPSGSYQMGRYPGEQDSVSSEDPQHTVNIAYDFYMAKYELTKAQWTALMGTTPWSGQQNVLDEPDSPAVYINWNDARAFVKALNAHIANTGQAPMTTWLPSEAEWEYACRAGTTTRFYWGDDPSYSQIGDYAWYRINAELGGEAYAHVVGQKSPNAWGLHDMGGNVVEWCRDDSHSDYNGAPADGSAWGDGSASQRIMRGGSWDSAASYSRSANRSDSDPLTAPANRGFRLAAISFAAPVITTDGGNGPGEDFVTAQAAVALEGTCDAISSRVLVNDSETGVTFADGATTWSFAGTLVDGANEFFVRSENALGVSSPETSITVTLDGSPEFSTGTLIDGEFNEASDLYPLDLDGDGDVDVLAGSSSEDGVCWWENTDGLGGAWTRRAIEAGFDSAKSVWAADLDGDGDLDALAASWDGDCVSWWANLDGAGTSWSGRQDILTGFRGASYVRTADMDRDGDLDVTVAAYLDDQVGWTENVNGDGSAWTLHLAHDDFRTATAAHPADADGDGDFDLFASVRDGSLVWFENLDATATSWTTRVIQSGVGPRFGDAADVDGDGDLDVIGADYDNGEVRWFENTDGVGGAWSGRLVDDTTSNPLNARAVDVDRDGDVDILAACEGDGEIAWWENLDGQGGAWVKRSMERGFVGAHAAAAADVDGDGDIDILGAAFDSDALVWWENRTIHRSAFFTNYSLLDDTAEGPYHLSLGDVNGDGDIDALLASHNGGYLSYFENENNANAWTETVVASGITGFCCAYGYDMDGDGDMDIIASTRQGDNSLRWYENDGDASGWSAHTVFTGTEWHSHDIVLHDIDKDGDVDIMISQLAPSGQVQIGLFKNQNGLATSWTEDNVTTAIGANEFRGGDIDGDGDLDLCASDVTTTSDDDSIYWYENADSEGSVWNEHLIGPVGSNRSEVYALVDMDGDGDVDAFMGTRETGAIMWWENTDGQGGAWANHVVASDVGEIHSGEAKDIDGDGDIDLAVVTYEGNLLWYENVNGDQSVWEHRLIDGAFDGGKSVVTGDLDRDGDLDLMAISRTKNDLVYWENRGGQFALATTGTAPAVIYDGATTDVLRVVATHRGRVAPSAGLSGADPDMELASIELLFEETPGDPLTSAEANEFIASLAVYVDGDADGVFNPAADSLVTSVETLDLDAAGSTSIALPDGDATCRIAAATSRTYFVVVEAAASVDSPRQFRVTHLTESTSRAEERAFDIPLSLEWTPNVATGQIVVCAPLAAPTVTTDGGNGPGVDYATSQAAVALEGTCDAVSSRVLVNDSETGVTYAAGATTWSFAGTLVEGANAFVVRSENALGVSSPETTITVTLETASPTPTATPTPTPTATGMPSDTPTPSVSASPTASPTPISSITPSPTPTPTNSMSPSVSASPSLTPTPTLTPTLTPTPTPTPTPSPTPSPVVVRIPAMRLGLGVLEDAAVSPDGSLIATAGGIGAALWDADEGKRLRILNAPGHYARAVAFTSDGRRVLTGGDDGTARLWEAASSVELRRYEATDQPILAVAMSPDDAWVLAGSEDGVMRAWQTDDPEAAPKVFEGHGGDVTAVAFSPDGSRVASASADDDARLWNFDNGQAILAFTGHSGDALSVAVSPDFRRIATGSKDETVKVWDVAGGPALATLSPHSGAVNSVAFSPDGDWLLTGSSDQSALTIDMATSQVAKSFLADSDGVIRAAFMPDGQRIVTASNDNRARIWNVGTQREIDRLTGHTEQVLAVAVSPDGARALTGSEDGVAYLWDIQTGELERAFTGHEERVNAVAFSPDGETIVTGAGLGGEDNTARVWRVSDGESLDEFEHDESVSCVAVSPDGSLALTGSDDNVARLWDLGDGSFKRELRGHFSAVNDCAFTSDGLYALTASSDFTARLWRVSDGALVRTFSYGALKVFSVAASPDSRRIVLGLEDGTAAIWDIDDETTPLVTLSGHGGRVSAVAFSPDGTEVLTVSHDHEARMWAAATGAPTRRYLGHTKEITDAAFASDGRSFLTGGLDGLGLLWEVTPPASRRVRDKMVLVAGGGEYDGNYIADQTRKLANMAHNIATIRGYKADDIMYLSSVETHSQNTDVDDVATSQGIIDAIEEWALDAKRLMIVLIDHGDYNAAKEEWHFLVDGRPTPSDKLSATALNESLNRAQSGADPLPEVHLFVDMCYAGGFINKCHEAPGDACRLILASTTPDHLANFGLEDGDLSYTACFLSRAALGASLFQAHKYARGVFRMVKTPADAPQAPMLDDNGDGLSNKYDGSVARHRYFGSYPAFGLYPPEIVDAAATATLSRPEDFELWCVTGTEETTSAQAIVAYERETRPENEPVVDHLTFDLSRAGGEERLSATLPASELARPGVYSVLYIATRYDKLGLSVSAEPKIRQIFVETPAPDLIAEYITGRYDEPYMLDVNADGVIDVADIVAALLEEFRARGERAD